jgi:hypothetical protein
LIYDGRFEATVIRRGFDSRNEVAVGWESANVFEKSKYHYREENMSNPEKIYKTPAYIPLKPGEAEIQELSPVPDVPPAGSYDTQAARERAGDQVEAEKSGTAPEKPAHADRV